MIIRGLDYSRDGMHHFYIGALHRAPIDYLENGFSIGESFPSDFVLNPKSSMNEHGTTTPFVAHKGTPYAITAGMLMEFQAIFMQANALMTFRSIPKAHKDLLGDKLSSQMSFHLPLAAIAISLGRADFPRNVTQSEFTKLCHITHDLCQLALCPDWPADPLYMFTPVRVDPLRQSPLPMEPIWWTDLHPGWRFMQIKWILQSLDLTLDDVGEAEDVLPLVCDKLGWTTPQFTLEKFLTFCALRAPHSELMQDILARKEDIIRAAAAGPSPVVRHISLYGSPLRQLSRGPNFRGSPVPERVWKWDVALQLYLDGEVFCPYCIAYKHWSGRMVQRHIARFRRVT